SCARARTARRSPRSGARTRTTPRGGFPAPPAGLAAATSRTRGLRRRGWTAGNDPPIAPGPLGSGPRLRSVHGGAAPRVAGDRQEIAGPLSGSRPPAAHRRSPRRPARRLAPFRNHPPAATVVDARFSRVMRTRAVGLMPDTRHVTPTRPAAPIAAPCTRPRRWPVAL